MENQFIEKIHETAKTKDPSYRHLTAREQLEKALRLGMLKTLPDQSSRNLDECIEANHKVRENRELERLGRL